MGGDVAGSSGALREKAGELRRVAVVASLQIHAISGEKALETTQDEQVEDNADGAVEENVDEVPVGAKGGGQMRKVGSAAGSIR